MNLYIDSAELKLLSSVRYLAKLKDGFALHMKLSSISLKRDGNDQLSIVIHVIRDLFKGLIGDIYVFDNTDILIIYHGKNQAIIDKAIYQISYLLQNDNIKNFLASGAINDLFAKYNMHNAEEKAKCLAICDKYLHHKESEAKELSISERFANSIDEVFHGLDILNFIKLEEISDIIDIEIDHDSLQRNLGLVYDINKSKAIKLYLKEIMDYKKLTKFFNLPNKSTNSRYIINLSISTILSNVFEEFAQSINKSQMNLIIAISASEVFFDTFHYMKAMELLKKFKFKICIDEIDFLGYLQLQSRDLGFNLVRIKYNDKFNIFSNDEVLNAINLKIAEEEIEVIYTAHDKTQVLKKLSCV